MTGSADTQAPVLTALTLPSVISLAGGDATITYSARATDNVGVASVWITFDRQIVGSAGPTATWLMREEFGEDFSAAPISRDLLIRQTNAPGPVQVLNVTVYDDAGNSTSYSTTDLQGLGLPTGFTLSSASPDTAPPELTALTLPNVVDITAGAAPVSYSVDATDDREVDGVWLTFERPASGTNPAANRWLVYEISGEAWDAGPLTRQIDIRGDTVPGTVALYSVSIFDVAGNARVYDRDDLLDLGLPLQFEVVNDAIAPEFRIDVDMQGQDLMLTVAREGDGLTAPQIGLVLRLDAADAGPATVDLRPAGDIVVTTEADNSGQVLRVMSEVTETLEQGDALFDITLPVNTSPDVDVTILGIEVEGDLVYLPDPVLILPGTSGDDIIAAPGNDPFEGFGGQGADRLIGGGGDDTLTGGPDEDIFEIRAGGGADVITDFAPGLDLLDLTDFGEAAAIAALSSAADTAAGALVSLPGGGTLLLNGLMADALDVTSTTYHTLPAPPADTVWEVQHLTLTDVPEVVSLAHTFDNPVAIARYSDPLREIGVVRVSEVTADSVRLAIQRPDYLDPAYHPVEVTLLVAEAGAYMIGENTFVQAGTIDTSRATVTYDTPFDAPPAVFAQVQTENDPGFVITRYRQSDADAFEVSLQQEEAQQAFGSHPVETVGWLAVSTGTDALGDGLGDLGAVEAARLGAVVDEEEYAVTFASDLGATPEVLVSLASRTGPDPAFAHLIDVSPSGFDVFVQEEQSRDAELSHFPEDIHYLAIENEGTVQGRPPDPDLPVIGEVISAEFSSDLTTIEFSHSFTSPVVIAGPLTMFDSEPAAPRIVDLTSTGLTIFAEEPEVYDGVHGVEDSTLLVLEAGRHVLADGTILEVGTIETDLLSPQGFAPVSFSQPFASAPSIMTQVQTFRGPDFVVTRQTNATLEGFEVAMQEQESRNGGGHFAETIGWIAIERGTGEWSGLDYEVGSAARLVDEQGRWHTYDTLFDDRPEMVGNLSSFRDEDVAILRTTGLWAPGFRGFAQEETSRDGEVDRSAREFVDYITFGGEGLLFGA